MEGSDREGTCACKGIRRCLLCEDPQNQPNQNTVADAKVVYC